MERAFPFPDQSPVNVAVVHSPSFFGFQAEDNSVSRDELTAVLLSSLESAHTILDNVEDAEQPEEGGGTDKLIETVTR